MPNHIQNRLTFFGQTENIAQLLDNIKGKNEEEEYQIDFNKIIPMPEELEIEIHSGIETAVKNSLKMGLSDNELIASLEAFNRKKSKSPLEFNDTEWEQYIQCLNNVRKHGYVYWYDWRIDKWGTKWGAYQQNDQRNSANTIYFQTAWSAPLIIIEALSNKFPEVEMELLYADEDSGCNTGKLRYKAGNAIEVFQPANQSKEGYEIYFELHPDSKEHYTLVGDTYEYKEDEDF